MIYYNDNDPKACAWLRELIAQGHLPPGDVDCRSILEVKPDEIRHYDQCHWFAGIAGWPLALRWAGLENARGIWTGSCPCQPFSCAGRRGGTDDERHLWPAFRDLIGACRPAVVFGEQVASADVVGKVGGKAQSQSAPVWFDGVCGDLEGAGYSCGAAVMGAHSVGAPHRRQRLYWVAQSECDCLRGESAARDGSACEAEREAWQRQRSGPDAGCNSTVGRMADAGRNGGCGRGAGRGEADSGRASCAASGRGDADRTGWARCDILPCRDGKARRVESQPLTMADGVSAHLDALRNAGLSEDEIGAAVSTFPLTHHAVGRMMLLRGYGNAISPQLAAEFIEAWKSTRGERQ